MVGTHRDCGISMWWRIKGIHELGIGMCVSTVGDTLLLWYKYGGVLGDT